MNVTCIKCNWISFAVTKEYAVKESAEFVAWFNKQDKKTQSLYGDGEPHDYKCQLCGGDKFRTSTDEETKKIYGCTISPVIYEPELAQAQTQVCNGNYHDK